MVTLADILPALPDSLVKKMQCHGDFIGTGCEGETRHVEGRHCEPLVNPYSMPIERGGIMDRENTNLVL